MSDRQAVRRQLRRQSIIEAATVVFAETGIHAASLEQIGAKVGLSKASLYYYVDSKEQLLIDVLAAVLVEIEDRAQQQTDPVATPLEQLRVRAKVHVETGIATPAGQLIAANIDTFAKTERAANLMREHEEPARQLLQAAIEHGLVREVSVTVAVKMLYSALNSIARWYDAAQGPVDVVFDQIWEIFVGGVAKE